MGKLRFRQVHLDFHTSEKIVAVGDQFDPKAFAETLKEANVDSVTCFARCHHGMIYYDTRFPARHPGLKRDLLKEQIDACHAVGIRVPIYITVGWDEYMARLHPEWLERNPDGTPNGAGPLQAGWKKLCFNTPYVDYVIEQTIEVLEKFGGDVDGFFFDIIQQGPCCCSYCMEGMEKEGYDPADLKDRTAYANKILKQFKERMTGTIRKYHKDCSIFYNAGHVGPSIRETLDTYTHLELESLPSGGWGYDHFPITVRYVKNLGKEYLGMTGKFQKSWGDFIGFKNQAALEYECFTALAHGAKCSVGDQLHPTGAISRATYQLIGNVYKQVKEKEAWCDDVQAVSEIAVFTPEAIPRDYKKSEPVYALSPSILGVYRMLEESHYQFDIVDGESSFDPYSLLIFPDEIVFDEALKEKVRAYIARGGKVILSHASGMDPDRSQFLLEELGIRYVGEAEYSPDFIVAGPAFNEGLLDTEYVMYDRGFWVIPEEGTEVLAGIWNPYFNRAYNHFCSHVHTPVEKDSGYPAVTQKGNVIYFAHPIFSMYRRHGMRAYKQLVLNAIKRLLPEKLIETNAPTTAHMQLNYQKEQDRYVIHILHYIPERRSERIDTVEDVIPLYHISLKVRLGKEPKKVYLAPCMEALDFSCRDGYVEVVVPKVLGHEMVVFE